MSNHEGAIVTADWERLDEALALQVIEVAVSGIETLVAAITEIAGWDDTERSDRREGARLRAAERHVTVAYPDALALGTARQVEIPHDHVARVE